MKYFDWSEEKNQKLKEERDISFEDVLIAVEESRILDFTEHPNSDKYPYQLIMVVEINRYAYLVPIVEDKEKYFMKTIIPSRKATKYYLIDKEKK